MNSGFHSFLSKFGLGCTTGITTFTICFFLIYAGVTLYLMRKKRSLLWIPALVVAILSSLVYWDSYGAVEPSVSNLYRLVFSVKSAMNLFLFNMASTGARLTKALFVEINLTNEQALAVQARLISLTGLYLCSIWTTSIVVVYFVARRFKSRLWLLFHKPSKIYTTHIFFGVDSLSLHVASEIYASKFYNRNKDNIVFVSFPKKEDIPARVPFSSLFKGIRVGKISVQDIISVVPDAKVLSAKKDFKHHLEKDKVDSNLGLNRLSLWIYAPTSKLYFLTGEGDNVAGIIRTIHDTHAEVFIKADRLGLNSRIENASPMHFHLIDEAYLTERLLKMTPELHPIHFVDKALDHSGEPLGWVRNPFHCLVVGYGNTQTGMISFLYEYGSFVGENKSPLPFSCDVIYSDQDPVPGDFQLLHPGLPEGLVHFNKLGIGTTAFWEFFEDSLHTLNYIIVATGNDESNASIALDMMEIISKSSLPFNPALVVKMEQPLPYRSLFDYYSSCLGVKDVYFFGSKEEIWSYDNIFNESFFQYAKLFHGAYNDAMKMHETWNSRIDHIMKSDRSDLWKRQEYLRKVEADCECYLHRLVKEQLIPKRLLNSHLSIPPEYNGKHCLGLNPEDESVLEYLAIGEHIRWQANLEMNGYRYGPGKREDIKEHNCLVDYSLLSPSMQHNDWIVLKTTLAILEEEHCVAPEGSQR